MISNVHSNQNHSVIPWNEAHSVSFKAETGMHKRNQTFLLKQVNALWNKIIITYVLILVEKLY